MYCFRRKASWLRKVIERFKFVKRPSRRVVIYLLRRRFNFFRGCPNAKTCTIILRGGAEQFLEETERSLHDAIMIVRRMIKNDSVVAGKCFAL